MTRPDAAPFTRADAAAARLLCEAARAMEALPEACRTDAIERWLADWNATRTP